MSHQSDVELELARLKGLSAPQAPGQLGAAEPGAADPLAKQAEGETPR